MELEIRTLSDIWTGGIDIGRCNEFRTSGIMGSIRWWYELTVRALGAYACCPSQKEKSCSDKNHCAVCELFGCTGWARKFKIRVETPGGEIVHECLKANRKYIFKFIDLRPIDPIEKWLLAKVIKEVVGPYGSIGGKMPNKPSEYAFSRDTKKADKQDKNHHRDFGLIEVKKITGLNQTSYRLEDIKKYLMEQDSKKIRLTNQTGWPTLNHLFCVKGDFKSDCFDRNKINTLMGLMKPPNPLAPGYCLQGKIGEKSKKIFSFKQDRVWGYCFDNEKRKAIVSQITSDLKKCNPVSSTCGSEFLNKIFEEKSDE